MKMASISEWQGNERMYKFEAKACKQTFVYKTFNI